MIRYMNALCYLNLLYTFRNHRWFPQRPKSYAVDVYHDSQGIMSLYSYNIVWPCQNFTLACGGVVSKIILENELKMIGGTDEAI